jgi:hypothetical protein
MQAWWTLGQRSDGEPDIDAPLASVRKLYVVHCHASRVSQA